MMQNEWTSFVILVADDDPVARESLCSIIEPEGFQIQQASSGEEALEIVRQNPVHLAMLDMHMPTLTGLETLRMVHQVNRLLPCILVTGDSSEGLMRQAFNANAYSVIPKPVSKNVVLYTVVRALGRAYGGGSMGSTQH